MCKSACQTDFWSSSYDEFVLPLDRSVARSIARSVARSLARSLNRSLARSLRRSVGRSLDSSVARSLDRSLGRSIARSIDRSIVARSIARTGFPTANLMACEKESYASTGRKYKTLTIMVPVQMRSSHMLLRCSSSNREVHECQFSTVSVEQHYCLDVFH